VNWSYLISCFFFALLLAGMQQLLEAFYTCCHVGRELAASLREAGEREVGWKWLSETQEIVASVGEQG